MWENVIGITNEQAGTNTGVEALINAPTVSRDACQRSYGCMVPAACAVLYMVASPAPTAASQPALPSIHPPTHLQIGGGRKATQARRQAAAEAVLATGGFDTSITNYQSLLAIAKQQGAVGSGAATRGACKVCGQMGHLTKQCRNGLASGGGGEAVEGSGVGELAVPIAASEDDAGDSLNLSSDSSDEERARWAPWLGAVCMFGAWGFLWAAGQAAGGSRRLVVVAAMRGCLCLAAEPVLTHLFCRGAAL
jgi:hypothetical protein